MTKVLLASRTQSALRALQQCLAQQKEVEVQTRLIHNGHADPLHALSFQPEVVVLHVDAGHVAELTAWAESGDVATRPPLIVVGPAGQAEPMRLAIRAGAKDFLPEPVTASDLIVALKRVCDESQRQSRSAVATGSVHAVVGVAGGAGTSFVATNVARILVAETGPISAPPMLVDMDLNFAPLSHYLDVQPERGLLQALETVEGLDQLALEGFGARHRSGLRLLCAAAGPAVLSRDVSAEKLAKLMQVLAACHPHVIVDLPHVIDSLTATIFSLASHVVLVMQQSVLHVRNATRLMQILKGELGIAPDRVHVIVNRHQKDALVQLDDIRRSLGTETLLTVPSHYRSALESADTGVPLYDADRNSAVVRAMRQAVFTLTGVGREERGGLLRRVFKLSPGAEA